MTVPPSTAPQPCLINYNARLYDPQIARFLSADSIIPDPTNGQSFNRYAYVSNNPLNAIDPSGNTRVPPPPPTQVRVLLTGSLIPQLFDVGASAYLASTDSTTLFGGNWLGFMGGGMAGFAAGGGGIGAPAFGGCGCGGLDVSVAGSNSAISNNSPFGWSVSGSWILTNPFGSDTIDANGLETVVIGGTRTWVPDLSFGFSAGAIPYPGINWSTFWDAAGLLRFGVVGLFAILSGDTEQDRLITVQHFTSRKTMQLIQADDNTLRSGTYVTLPSEVAGMNQAQVAQALEINPANAEVSTIFQTYESNLAPAPNGPTTSGGAVQYVLVNAAPAGTWAPTPK